MPSEDCQLEDRMNKPYKVMKFIICDLANQECGDVWPYSEYMPKPKCEDCDLFIEAFMKKHGLKPPKKEKP